MSIKTVCGNVTNELRLTGKKLFSVKDIVDAVEKVGPTSKNGVDSYLGNDGNLAKEGYIRRCKGGWELTETSRRSTTIVVKVSPVQNTVDVLNAISAATKRFGNIVELSMEV